MYDSCDPMNCSLPVSSVYGDSPGKNTGVGCHFLLPGGGLDGPPPGRMPPPPPLPIPGIEHGSPTLQMDSLPTEL